VLELKAAVPETGETVIPITQGLLVLNVIRRCFSLHLDQRESIDFDPAELLRGNTGLSAKLVWRALAGHLPAPVDLVASDIDALAQFGPTLWVKRDEAERRVGVERVERLLSIGLLVGDDEAAASRADRQLREDSWHPMLALAHRLSRWSMTDSVAGTRSAQIDAVAQRVRESGPPPPECHERPDRLARFVLPAAPHSGLDDLLQRRTTCRNFARERGISQAQLGELLDRVFGVRGRETLAPGAVALKKNSPSGGSLHPIEAYVVLRRVEGLPPGLYHYACGSGALDLLREMSTEEAGEFMLNAVAGQDFFADAPAHVVLTARFPRPQWKYRSHAKMYRVIQIEVGHLAQNLYLSATQQGLGAYITAAINEVEIEQAFGLDGMREGPLAVCGFGCRAAERSTIEFDPKGLVWPGGTGGEVA